MIPVRSIDPWRRWQHIACGIANRVQIVNEYPQWLGQRVDIIRSGRPVILDMQGPGRADRGVSFGGHVQPLRWPPSAAWRPGYQLQIPFGGCT
jgi:hypothetical protein